MSNMDTIVANILGYAADKVLQELIGDTEDRSADAASIFVQNAINEAIISDSNRRDLANQEMYQRVLDREKKAYKDISEPLTIFEKLGD